MNGIPTLFLVFEILIIAFCVFNFIFWGTTANKLGAYLKEKYSSRWLELHTQYQGVDNESHWRVNYKYRPYIWGGQDNDDETIRSMKMKIRRGQVLFFSTFFLHALNLYVFYQLGFFH